MVQGDGSPEPICLGLTRENRPLEPLENPNKLSAEVLVKIPGPALLFIFALFDNFSPAFPLLLCANRTLSRTLPLLPVLMLNYPESFNF